MTIDQAIAALEAWENELMNGRVASWAEYTKKRDELESKYKTAMTAVCVRIAQSEARARYGAHA